MKKTKPRLKPKINHFNPPINERSAKSMVDRAEEELDASPTSIKRDSQKFKEHVAAERKRLGLE